MVKKSVYPKTKRFDGNAQVFITEKIDGSNLTIFKKDGEIHFATRNNIIQIPNDVENCKNILYKGMYGWIQDNHMRLCESLNEGSAICGEWIGMGNIKYPYLDKKFYMFAKANIDEDLILKKINYIQDYFQYSFVDKNIPDFIGIVPTVKTESKKPSIQDLDALYHEYCLSQNRQVEGFIICQNNEVEKYVRLKDGKMQSHHS